MKIRDAFFALLIGSLFLLSVLLVRPFVSFILAAILFAVVLSPLQERLQPRLGPRISALLLTVLTVAVTILPMLVLSVIVLTQGTDATETVDRGPLLGQLQRLFDYLGLRNEIPTDTTAIARQLGDVFIGQFAGLLDATVRLSIGLSLTVFLIYYLLIDGERFVDWLQELTPLPQGIQDDLYRETTVVTWAVLKGHVLVAITQGIVGGLGFFITGVPNVVFWTFVMILFAFVPVIGVGAIWVPAVAYLFLEGRFTAAIVLLVYSGVVVSYVDNYLRAFFVEHGAKLHPAVVLVGVLGGLYFLGALGLFVGPIILAVFKATLVVAKRYYDL